MISPESKPVKRRRRPWPRTPLFPPPMHCECADCQSYRLRQDHVKAFVNEAADMAVREGPEVDCE